MADERSDAQIPKHEDSDTPTAGSQPVTPAPTPSTTAITEQLDDALTDPSLPRVPGTSLGASRPA